MVSALICGALGTVITFLIGIPVLGLSPVEIFLCVIGSNLGGLLALLFTQVGAKKLVKGAFLTWLCFLSVYFLTEILVAYPLREGRNLLWLLIPLIFSGGFSIVIFGPIQDRIIARNQRRARV